MLSLNAHVCPTAPCRDPGVPRQGSRIGDDFRHGSKVTFTCRDDYNMEGVREISCSNGAWSNRVPSCKAPCAKLSKPANGYMRGDFRHGSQVRFVCLYGYQRIGAASSTCNDASCRRPEPPRNGGMRGDNFNHNEKVVFYCDDNYQLVGESEITCKDGSWSDSYPTCVATCPNPAKPAHGRRLSNDFQDGRTVAFECDEGFNLFGNKAILCSGGSWNASMPECKADFNFSCLASCDHPGGIAHGQLTSQYFSHGQLVRYKCDLGYSLEGNHELTCNNGDWNSNLPNCKGESVDEISITSKN
ncbi:CUB and sushi domain-containing protein 1 [Acropora cervicornis]|uniref:CUB and sushi domain-containing protein 1 n=1 Tax=Acropora cervicornis TaxID=6130 RepID=A0AAD9QT33_ACRCE|nr:CUB and sushi domain-containing protein 1 [Acropora cervicornis]